MRDVGFWLVLVFAFYGPWLARRLEAPKMVIWPIFFAVVALLGLSLFDYVHVWLPKLIGHAVEFAALLAIAVRLFIDFSEPAEKPAAK